MKFSKRTAPFHITYELGQMTEIPLGMDLGLIPIEKFHTKAVSILSFLMFEECGFRENYPFTVYQLRIMFIRSLYASRNTVATINLREIVIKLASNSSYLY